MIAQSWLYFEDFHTCSVGGAYFRGHGVYQSSPLTQLFVLLWLFQAQRPNKRLCLVEGRPGVFMLVVSTIL